MGRPKKIRPTPEQLAASAKATTRDITEINYPDGVPVNSDGSVAQDAMITLEEADKIGAITPESAAYNRELAKTIDKKIKGAIDVNWGDAGALEIFDRLRKTWPAKNFDILFQRVEPDKMDCRPEQMHRFKSSRELYDHIDKTMATPGRYFLRFKENGGAERGRGYIDMPASQSQQHQQANNMAAPPYPPVMGPFGGYPYPPPGYPPPGYPPPGYPPSGYPPSGYEPPAPPPPPQTYPQPAKAAASPAPEPSPPLAQTYFQPPPAPPQDRGYDVELRGQVAAMYQENLKNQQMLMAQQLQMAQVLGAVEEMKRERDRGAQPPPNYSFGLSGHPEMQPGYPQPQPPHQPPAGYPPPPPGYPQQPYGMVHQPPTPAIVHQAIPVPANPMDQINQAASMLAGVMNVQKNIRRAVGLPDARETDFDDEPEALPVTPLAPPPPPFSQMHLGAGPDAPVAVFNQDGSLHWQATGVGLIPKIITGAKGLLDSLQAQAQQQQQMQAQMHAQQQAFAQQQANARALQQVQYAQQQQQYAPPTSPQYAPPPSPPPVQYAPPPQQAYPQAHPVESSPPPPPAPAPQQNGARMNFMPSAEQLQSLQQLS